MIKIFIDPRAKISYASYYLYGLYKIYGRKRVRFSMKYFKDLVQKSVIDDFDHYFAYIYLDGGKVSKRIVVDYRDNDTINLPALEWCNTYGKVNYNSKSIRSSNIPLDSRYKIIPLGPNFGVKIWTKPESILYFTANFLKSWRYLPTSLRQFFAGYHWQMKRLPLDKYLTSNAQDNYIFFISSLYGDKFKNHTNTNHFRAIFIRACKKNSSIKFDGGLLINRNSGSEWSKYEDIVTNQYIKAREYVERIRKSIVVFNTPALWGCHGWKLGEFLAMGKAIISTSFRNEMPIPLSHGKNIHFINADDNLDVILGHFVNNPSYRHDLELGAKAYFEQYLAPDKVVLRLIGQP